MFVSISFHQKHTVQKQLIFGMVHLHFLYKTNTHHEIKHSLFTVYLEAKMFCSLYEIAEITRVLNVSDLIQALIIPTYINHQQLYIFKHFQDHII